MADGPRPAANWGLLEDKRVPCQSWCRLGHLRLKRPRRQQLVQYCGVFCMLIVWNFQKVPVAYRVVSLSESLHASRAVHFATAPALLGEGRLSAALHDSSERVTRCARPPRPAKLHRARSNQRIARRGRICGPQSPAPVAWIPQAARAQVKRLAYGPFVAGLM